MSKSVTTDAPLCGSTKALPLRRRLSAFANPVTVGYAFKRAYALFVFSLSCCLLRAVPHRCSQFAVSNAESLLPLLGIRTPSPMLSADKSTLLLVRVFYRLGLCVRPTFNRHLWRLPFYAFPGKRALSQPICPPCSVRGSLRLFGSMALRRPRSV